jgi:hypothetical protein
VTRNKQKEVPRFFYIYTKGAFGADVPKKTINTMKKIFLFLSITMLLLGCDSHGYGYIESLEGTVWKCNLGGGDYRIIEFFANGSAVEKIELDGESSFKNLKWYLEMNGKLNFYWNEYKGEGPWMTGTFDKYEGRLFISDLRYELIANNND